MDGYDGLLKSVIGGREGKTVNLKEVINVLEEFRAGRRDIFPGLVAEALDTLLDFARPYADGLEENMIE